MPPPEYETGAVVIREATDADWPEIWPIYREIADTGETYALPPAGNESVDRAQWMVGPDRVVYVALDPAGRVVGSAILGPNRPGPGAHVATASFMVPAAARGQGVGRALGGYVLAAAQAAGFHSMQFNAVVDTNTAAVRLWLDLGFTIIGTVPEAFAHPVRGLVGLHVMYRRL